MKTINLGKVRITDKGVWVPDYAGGYGILDVVTFEKGSYMSKVSANSAALTDRASWVPFVDTASIELAIQEANEAAGLADQARLAIEGNLAKLELADAEHSSQIRDIENVLSTANLGQSAQLSVSGIKTVSLPKNASNGGMSVKLEGLTAKNLVVNGDFRNGMTGLIFSPEIINKVLVGDVLSFTATAAGNYAGVYVSVVIGRKYYIQTTFKSTSNQVSFSLAGVSQIAHSGGGGFETKSTILSWASPTGNYVIRVQDLRTSGWDEIQIKGGNSGLICIDLTAIFGAGNEPTKEQCDLIFSDYFEGVKSFVPTGRIRSVGKNIARVPKNRIIFGGVEAYADGNSIVIKGTTGGAGVAFRLTDIIKGGYGIGSFETLFSGNTIGGAGSYVVTISRTGTGGAIFVYKDNAYLQLATGTNPITVVSSLSGVGFYVGVATSVDARITIQIERGTVASAIETYRDTNLYLTAPELRSNGTVKDEIRKGVNGYEHVKRVGVGTSNGEIVVDGGFDDPTKWTVSGGTSNVSGGTLKIIAVGGVASQAVQTKTITAGRIYKYSINVLQVTGTLFIQIGNTLIPKPINTAGLISGFFIAQTGGPNFRIVKDLNTSINTEIDNFSIIEYNPTDGAATSGGEVVIGGSLHYTLATQIITTISHGGILNSAENGTVYYEPIIADAGVYGTNMGILLTDYPIASIEEIIKHENGVDTYLDVSTAVIAGDKLSFTHPSLQSGDLVLFTYSFAKESTNGNITATFYDSNVVKIDTVTGKAYRINEVVTNGVLTRTLTEV